jgi:hypothetical protein
MGDAYQLRGIFQYPTELPFLAYTTSATRLAATRLQIVAHLYAGYALELLAHLQGNDAWKPNGLIIGSPAFQLSTSSADNSSTKMGGDQILENQMELRPDQVQVLIEFLTAQESLLKRISSYYKEDAEQALSKVYQLIAAYGRRVREGKRSDKLIETTKPSIRPIFIPRGNYFTVHQAAQICHVTSKQIRACSLSKLCS